jgi:hypothetical protein
LHSSELYVSADAFLMSRDPRHLRLMVRTSDTCTVLSLRRCSPEIGMDGRFAIDQGDLPEVLLFVPYPGALLPTSCWPPRLTAARSNALLSLNQTF